MNLATSITIALFVADLLIRVSLSGAGHHAAALSASRWPG